MSPRTKVRVLTADHCFASWDRTLIQVWQKSTSHEAMVELHDFGRAFLTEAPGPATLITIIEPDSEVPKEKARRKLAQFNVDVVAKMALAVAVPEGGGFRPAIVRSVATALTVLMPHRVPYKFAESVPAGVRLLAPHLRAEAGGAHGLIEAILDLRAEMGALPP